jgi:GT2 family glycosyltransferase
MPKIVTMIPYLPGKSLGTCYNEMMSLLNEDQWGCFIDHDAMWTTTMWYQQISEAIEKNPEAGIFVPRTNRIGCGWMKAPGVSPRNHDIAYHRQVGWDLHEKEGSNVHDVTVWEDQPSRKPLSGVSMLLSKKTWSKVGGFKKGFLTVDNDMHRRVRAAGLKAYLLLGVYVYHWYRARGRGS